MVGLPGQTLYHYVTAKERRSIEKSKRIQSRSGITWYAFAPPLFSTRDDVKKYLALPEDKDFSFGPVSTDEITSYVVYPRTISPFQLPDGTWVVGGATEFATQDVVHLQAFRKLK